MTVEPDLSLPGHPEVLALGDMVRVRGADGKPVAYPGVAPVAMQKGRHAAKVVRARLEGGAGRAVPLRGQGQPGHDRPGPRGGRPARRRVSGFPAWILWLVVHIWYLVGFQSRLVVFVRWGYSFLIHGRGARIIGAR